MNIGLMINYIDNEYSKLVIKGATDAVENMAVRHLIKHCGRKKIGFVSDAKGNKEAMPVEEAFSIIRSDTGTHFDPLVAEVFLELRTDIEKEL